MKRSEMISILEQAVYDTQRCDTFDADKVLKTLEEAGMLPPRTRLENLHEDDCSWHDDGDDNCSCGGLEDNCWEKE